MIRSNFRALGLAFIVAVAATSMMAATAAQGSQLHANTAAGTAVLTGEQIVQNVFQITPEVEGPQVKCKKAHFEGLVAGAGPQITTSELTITAQYSDQCQFLGLNSTITMNGCKYTFTQANPTAALTSLVDITGCTAANPRIEVHVPGCTLTVPQQNGLSHVTFANVPPHVDVNATVTGITYETHGAACAHQPETVLTHNGTYKGTVTVKGFNHLGTQSTTVHGHQYNKNLAGQTAVSLVAT